MTEGKHTPGEWFRDGTTVYALNDQGTNRMLISCGGGYVYQPHDRTSLSHERTPSNEVEANARLISAAPELLDALGNARTQIVILGGDVIEVDGKIVSDAIQAAVLQIIDDAIAKATGAS